MRQPIDHRPVPGELLVHPLSLAALAALLVNDHLLKELWGNSLTGKLSDIAGVALFPLLLLTVARLGLDHRWPEALRRPEAVMIAIAVTAAGFASVKLLGPVGDAYASTIGALRWVARLGTAGYQPIDVVRDPTDVLVLPILTVSYYVARRLDARTASDNVACSSRRGDQVGPSVKV